MLVGELEGLDDTDGLLDGAADGQVVDVRGTQDTLGVDEEGTTKGNALLGEENVVGLADGVVSVGELSGGKKGMERYGIGREEHASAT